MSNLRRLLLVSLIASILVMALSGSALALPGVPELPPLADPSAIVLGLVRSILRTLGLLDLMPPVPPLPI